MAWSTRAGVSAGRVLSLTIGSPPSKGSTKRRSSASADLSSGYRVQGTDLASALASTLALSDVAETEEPPLKSPVEGLHSRFLLECFLSASSAEIATLQSAYDALLRQVCMRACTCMHVPTHTPMTHSSGRYACMHACMHACTHLHTRL